MKVLLYIAVQIPLDSLMSESVRERMWCLNRWNQKWKVWKVFMCCASVNGEGHVQYCSPTFVVCILSL